MKKKLTKAYWKRLAIMARRDLRAYRKKHGIKKRKKRKE